MVRSLKNYGSRPNYWADDRVYSDYTLGEYMLRLLNASKQRATASMTRMRVENAARGSIDKMHHWATFKAKRLNLALRDSMTAAQWANHPLKWTAEMVLDDDQLVEDHLEYLDMEQSAREERLRGSLIRQPSEYRGKSESNTMVQREMDRQDIDRLSNPQRQLTQRQQQHAALTDVGFAAQGFEGAGGSVGARPVQRHIRGGQRPNARQLKLENRGSGQQMASSAITQLKHNPSGGGGFHNPHSI